MLLMVSCVLLDHMKPPSSPGFFFLVFELNFNLYFHSHKIQFLSIKYQTAEEDPSSCGTLDPESGFEPHLDLSAAFRPQKV